MIVSIFPLDMGTDYQLLPRSVLLLNSRLNDWRNPFVSGTRLPGTLSSCSFDSFSPAHLYTKVQLWAFIERILLVPSVFGRMSSVVGRLQNLVLLVTSSGRFRTPSKGFASRAGRLCRALVCEIPRIFERASPSNFLTQGAFIHIKQQKKFSNATFFR